MSYVPPESFWPHNKPKMTRDARYHLGAEDHENGVVSVDPSLFHDEVYAAGWALNAVEELLYDCDDLRRQREREARKGKKTVKRTTRKT